MADQPKTRKAQREETEAALKAAARAEFARLGYLNTKITDITAAAGRAAGSFYQHFTSKEQLLEVLVAQLQAEVGARLAQHDGEHDLSEPAVLREHVAAFWASFHRDLAVTTALAQAAMVDRAFAARLRELFAPDLAVLTGHLEQLADKGFQLPGPADQIAQAISGMMFQFALNQLAAGDPLPDDEAVDLLTGLIRKGIAG